MRGKFFCRGCHVKGKDASDNNEGGTRAEANASDDESDGEADDSGNKKGKRRKRVLETFNVLKARISRFMKPGNPREVEDTLKALNTQSTLAMDNATRSKVKTARTATGIKDTFQDHFLGKLDEAVHKLRGETQRQDALNKAIKELPANIISPIWRINGINPHTDTPVEVLHVVLLGFVKYLWRDLITNQIGKKNDKKLKELQARLSSFDVSGLGISPLAGKTLVQYSGSLTGRDFRTIAQVAPFVIHDMCSEDCHRTWLALSRLVPMIWQPVIQNIETYIPELESAIEQFLLSAAKWTSRWFNKPKFHVLVHLPAHIRRFGPAMLFATEAFESFNAIIRAKSVHSNRHAPSRDIALAFAQANRVRHILSGGLFQRARIELVEQSLDSRTTARKKVFKRQPFSKDRNNWHHFGPEPEHLAAQNSIVVEYLGLQKRNVPPGIGTCVGDKEPPRRWADTQTGKRALGTAAINSAFFTNTSVVVANHDVCMLNQFVVVRRDLPVTAGEPSQSTYIGRVVEILRQRAILSNECHSVLVQVADVSELVPHYGMPRVRMSSEFRSVNCKNILCTVNTYHNCVAHQCATTASVPVRQEGKVTSQNQARVKHKDEPDDLILNLTQMRDAALLDAFRLPGPKLIFEEVCEETARKECRETLAPARSRPASAAGSVSRPATAMSNAVASPSRPQTVSPSPAIAHQRFMGPPSLPLQQPAFRQELDYSRSSNFIQNQYSSMSRQSGWGEPLRPLPETWNHSQNSLANPFSSYRATPDAISAMSTPRTSVQMQEREYVEAQQWMYWQSHNDPP